MLTMNLDSIRADFFYKISFAKAISDTKAHVRYSMVVRDIRRRNAVNLARCTY